MAGSKVVSKISILSNPIYVVVLVLSINGFDRSIKYLL